MDILNDLKYSDLQKILHSIPGLEELVTKHNSGLDQGTRLFLMEFALHGLAEYSMLSKRTLANGLEFKDLLSGMFTMPDFEDDPDEDFKNN